MGARQAQTPLIESVSGVFSDMLHLAQTEMRLARAEVSEKFDLTANVAVLVGIAVTFLLAGLLLLLMGAVRWLALAGLPEEWGFLLVGAVAIAVGIILAWQANQRVKAEAILPKKTIGQAKADADLLREELT